MARSQPQWRRGSQLLLLAAAVALVLLVAAGSADAVCPYPYKICAGRCVNLNTNKDHCGWCNHKCPVPKNGEAECKDGQCKKICPANWYYNSAKNECYH